MNRLQAELQRLYLPQLPGHRDAGAWNPITPDGLVRAMVLALARPADWQALSAVWQGIQADLDLPAPAVAVSGTDGYQLWFSLQQPVPAAQAAGFLASLRQRYLGDVAPHRVTVLPAADASAPGQWRHANRVPAEQEQTGHWSAFVAPDLAPMFADDPWLDLPPSPEAQADLLSRLASIAPADFERALQQLGPATIPASPRVSAIGADATGAAAHPTNAEPGTASPALDPRRFLLQVMNDPAAALHLRIEAAKALLPFVEDRRR